MQAVEARRAAEKQKPAMEKVEWERMIVIFPIDEKKKQDAINVVRGQPPLQTPAGV